MRDSIFLVRMKHLLVGSIHRSCQFNPCIREYYAVAGTASEKGRTRAIWFAMICWFRCITGVVVFLAITGDAGKNNYV
ncbi:hypothetical protein [Chitinophaga arvensicola]|uniref:hypothetical protein n=1 Tax=Chitinophaga arvensicola TaxID=29529 RepID=UPI000B7E5C4C|nr:hypothetical protein [Chitinophaga arvensicola]